MPAPWRHGARCLVPLLLLAVLVGCADDEPDRRFSTDPVPSIPVPTPSPWPTPLPADGPAVQASPVDPATLLSVRGAPDHLYFRRGNELWALDPASSEMERLLAPPAGTTLPGLASSPSGDRVAALLAAPSGEEAGTTVVVLDSEGDSLTRVERVEDALPPDLDPSPRPQSISWSPQGELLLIGFAPGLLVSLPVAGSADPTVLLQPAALAEPAEAAWSPTGESVAYLAPGRDAPDTTLWLAPFEATPVAPSPVLPSGDGVEAVTELAWLPNGRALLFAETAGESAAVRGGDLWRIAPDGTDRQLIASAGSAVPVGQIRMVTPSTDGRAVAYTVEVPAEQAPRFHSLWVRDLATGREAIRVDVPEDERVTGLWWTAQGLVFRTAPAQTPAIATPARGGSFYLVAADGTAELIVHLDDAAATPVGAGTPEPPATPSASPRASPVA